MAATDEGRIDRVLGMLFLDRSRALLRNRFGRALTALVGLVYGALALFIGGMVTLYDTGLSGLSVKVVTPYYSNAWWDYPALLVSAPWGAVALPFLPTVAMVVVAVGVGIGMSVGVVLSLRLLRARRDGSGGAALSSTAGFTPALIALVTLGACCSTTAAATAGIGAIAQASGTGLDQLLFNNWYLDLFQVGVLWVALLAQEQLIAVFGTLLGGADAAVGLDAPVRFDRRAVGRTALRAGLIAAGIVWAIAAAAPWTSFDPVPVTPALVAAAVLEHLVPGGLAIAVGLAGAGALRTLARTARTAAGGGVRVLLAVSGLSLATYAPASLASAGYYGFGNEVLGAVGAPASWGAVAPPTLTASVLALRWAFEFLLLGGFAVAVAVAPARVAVILSSGSATVPDLADASLASRPRAMGEATAGEPAPD